MKKLLLTLLVSLVFLQACGQQEPLKDASVEPVPKIADEVRLTPGARQRLELKTELVQAKGAVESLSTTGEVKADENRVFHVNSLTSGRVTRDYVQLGQAIHTGQTLAIIQNLEIVKIYTDFIHQSHQNKVDTDLAQTKLELAQKNYNRIKTLFEEHVAPEKELIKAASDVQIEEQTVRGLKECARHVREEAKAMLAAYGVKLPDKLQDTIDGTSPIIAPRSGIIAKKNVTVGDVVSNTEPLYIVEDLTKVWLDLAVYDKQLQSIREGSSVSFVCDSLPGKTFSGKVTYIKPSAEESSGTFVARVILNNPNFELKPGMLGQVKIQNQAKTTLPFVPEEAIQKYGNETFIFLDQEDGTYKKHDVSLGERSPDGYFVLSGLTTGERIVTKGSFALKAEMLKSLSGDE